MKPRGRVIKLGVWRRCRNRRRRRQQTRGAREETTDVVWRAHSGRRRVPAFMWLFYCFLPVGRVVTTSAAQEENSNSSRLQAALEASHNIWASSRDQRHRHSFSWAGPGPEAVWSSSELMVKLNQTQMRVLLSTLWFLWAKLFQLSTATILTFGTKIQPKIQRACSSV